MNIYPAWKDISGVYCIENMLDKKRYIGSSRNIQMRLYVHRSYLRGNTHWNQRLQDSWNKHGEENFVCYMLESVEVEDLFTAEQKFMDTMLPEYNHTDAANTFRSEESKIKQSITRTARMRAGLIETNCAKVVSTYNFDGDKLETFKSVATLANSHGLNKTTVRRLLSDESYVIERYPWMVRYGNEDKVPSYWSRFPYYILRVKDGADIKVAHLFHLKNVHGIKWTQHIIKAMGRNSTHFNAKYFLDLVKPDELLGTPERTISSQAGEGSPEGSTTNSIPLEQ